MLKQVIRVVSASILYGGTYNLFDVTLARFRVKTNFVNFDDPKNFAERINKHVKAVSVETIGNFDVNFGRFEKSCNDCESNMASY
ncbi:PLP-dependent transferase [Liquorilactobacillus sicerae]|uniref:PLP-dependent transferase n=1 Tax=Liquorilactobacillus sicerae TaxID=1416943 RepID=UPI00247FAB17|nr:PLP-dependent transferase [Liquorilactobacillus sicerae]